MASNRNRSEGWQHAKLTGHENERLIAELTERDPDVQRRLLDAAHISGYTIKSVEYSVF